MLLNPKGNSFYFVFPRGFFPPKVVDKYLPYIKRQPIPFDNINDYMNSTIQTIGFPNMAIDSVEQIRNFGKKISYKSSTNVQDLFSHDFSIGFKNVDGFINYFIMLDTILNFLNFQNDQLRLPDLPLRIMDNEGNIVTSVTFKEVILTSYSELQLSYASNANQFTQFTLGFKCNYLDIVLEAK
jgi:hypothetical protein